MHVYVKKKQRMSVRYAFEECSKWCDQTFLKLSPRLLQVNF